MADDKDKDDIPDDLPDLGTIELQGYVLNLNAYLKKDYDDISTASQELPAIAEWINMMLQYYMEERLIAKQKIKEEESTAYFRIMKDQDFEWKKTDAMVTRAVDTEESVMKAHRRHARLAGWVVRLQNLQLSFQSKLDLVRSTESTRRRIFDSPPDDQS